MTSDRVKVTIHGKVYDVTDFLDQHPGGRDVFLEYRDKDATQEFDSTGHSDEAKRRLKTFLLGDSDAEPSKKEESKKSDAVMLEIKGSATVSSSRAGPFVWFWLSAGLGALAVIAAASTGNIATDFRKVYPAGGELGLGKFSITGKLTTEFVYPFLLQAPTYASIISSWVFYLCHQLGQYYILFSAQRAKEQKQLRWTESSDGWNPYAKAMLRLNLFFVVMHFIQTHLFYDGLASTVPEVTSQGSVIMMLVCIYILEMPRRGIIFNSAPKRNTDFFKAFTQFAKKHHGYIASFGIVYTFWYHPMEASGAHFTGFMYQFLLLIQSSLLYQQSHRNRWWTLALECFVAAHAFVTAIYQRPLTYLMFLFGFVFTFVLNHLYGSPIVQSYLSSPRDEKTRSRRYWTVLFCSIVLYLTVALLAYGLEGAIGRSWMIINIPMAMYASTLFYTILYGIAYFADNALLKHQFYTESSRFRIVLGVCWAILSNVAILLTFSLYFQATLRAPVLGKTIV